MKQKKQMEKISEATVWDLNYVLHEPFRMLEKFPQKAKSRTIFPGVRLFFMMLLRSIYKRAYSYPKINRPDFLYVSGTINNYKVLHPLASRSENAAIIGKNCTWQLPKFQAYWFALPYFFHALSLVKNANGYRKKAGIVYFERIWVTYGYYKLVRKLLQRIQPKVIVVANDHLILYRCLMRVAKEMNITSVYVQHAGTAPHFPPLEFDYAILDGQLSYESYLTQGPKNSARVFLSGSPRFDEIVKIRFERSVTADTIGIAVNAVDEPERVESFLKQLMPLGKKVILRPHPGIVKLKKKYMDLVQKYGMEFSDPLSEATSGFLTRIHLLISNTSYIQFEAVLSGIQALQYPFSTLNEDAYGFVKNKCISILQHVNKIDHYFKLPATQDQLNYIRKSITNYDDLLQGKNTTDRFIEILHHEILPR